MRQVKYSQYLSPRAMRRSFAVVQLFMTKGDPISITITKDDSMVNVIDKVSRLPDDVDLINSGSYFPLVQLVRAAKNAVDAYHDMKKKSTPPVHPSSPDWR